MGLFRTLSATTILTGSLLLGGCATSQVATGFPAPKQGDEGVVILETKLIPGSTNASTIAGRTDDCEGPGLGITVNGTTNTGNYLFDMNGEPCDAAQTLFDGRNTLDKRQTDPSINLTFHDGTTTKKDDPDNLPALKPIPEVRLKSELLSTAALAGKQPTPGSLATIEPAAGGSIQLGNKAVVPAVPVQGSKPNGPDPLVATLAKWETQDSVYAERSAEANAAAERNIDNITKQTQGSRDQENMARLMATLRERERQVQEEQRRHEETLERAQQNREITTAAKQQWQQKQQELESSLSATQARLAQYEQLAQRLAADKEETEKGYQQKLASLSSDLKVAEGQADNSRRQLVLQAAAKIAEAEQLASAAKLQEQEIKLREATRLKAEADTMMDRALAIKAGNNVVVSGMNLPPAVPLAIMETPVVLHASGQTLPDILANILNQAKPQAGEWRADWQLSPATQYLLKEKWSLTAEASIQQVLAQLQEQVRASHGISLTFTQFGQSRLIVVTDATPQTAEKTN